jgi:hypothetical protein
MKLIGISFTLLLMYLEVFTQLLSKFFEFAVHSLHLNFVSSYMVQTILSFLIAGIIVFIFLNKSKISLRLNFSNSSKSILILGSLSIISYISMFLMGMPAIGLLLDIGKLLLLIGLIITFINMDPIENKSQITNLQYGLVFFGFVVFFMQFQLINTLTLMLHTRIPFGTLGIKLSSVLIPIIYYLVLTFIASLTTLALWKTTKLPSRVGYDNVTKQLIIIGILLFLSYIILFTIGRSFLNSSSEYIIYIMKFKFYVKALSGVLVSIGLVKILLNLPNNKSTNELAMEKV